MKRQTRKNRRGANLAAARAVKAQRDAERIARTVQTRRVSADIAAHIIREYIGDGMTLADVQRDAENRVPGGAFVLGAFERLAERRMRTHSTIVRTMREENAGAKSARLHWPDTADRTPDRWARRIVAPSGGIARLAWREQLVRFGARAAADYCEARGIGWTYPATETVATVATPDVVLATTAADRAAIADGIA